MAFNQRLRHWLDTVADRLGITPWTFVAGTVAIVAAGVGGWWALSAPSVPPPEEVLPRVGSVVEVVPTEITSTTTTVASLIVVHVDGAVVAPGVHELEPGARVVDAIAAAQGLLDTADRTRLNLAAVVSDGQRVWVPAIGEEEPAVIGPVGGASAADESQATPVNINTADVALLETLPGVGPAIALAIVQHRDDHGPFKRVTDLLDVSGIGTSKLAQIESLVAV